MNKTDPTHKKIFQLTFLQGLTNFQLYAKNVFTLMDLWPGGVIIHYPFDTELLMTWIELKTKSAYGCSQRNFNGILTKHMTFQATYLRQTSFRINSMPIVF